MTANVVAIQRTETAALGTVIERFLRRDRFEPTTRTAYAKTLAVLLDQLDAATPITAVTTADIEDLLDRWTGPDVAATTHNRHRAALLSLFGWAVDRGYLPTNPVALTEPRKVRRRTEDERRERPIAVEQLEALWALDHVPARDKLLWRMAYETWARADELLTLDITDLDITQRQGIVHAKGGDREPIWWATGTARLLPRVIKDRKQGPVFLASRLPARPMPTADTDPASGRARLSYRQAERLFGQVGHRIDPNGMPWTLHRLRHAGIAHAVEQGMSIAQIRAKSRHASLRSLEVYANPSAAAVRAMTDALDQEARHQRRR